MTTINSTIKPKENKDGQTIIQNEHIENLPLNQLSDFQNHPFKVQQDADFERLIESIKENGVLIPAVARPKGDSYELIAGHRRRLACRILGIDTMPVLIRDMTDAQAVIAMVDSNVQRENIMPSEKAFAYKMKLEALKKQGKRTDLTSGQVVQKKWSVHAVAEESGENYKQIQRYIRLTELIPQLLKLVDEKRIAFNPAVELSYLTADQQTALWSAMEAEQSTPSLAQAQRLKALSAEGVLNTDSILEVMREQKANQKEQIKIPYDKVKAILKKDMLQKEIEEYILKAVADYRKRELSRNRDSR
jgi:ParB family chromosome partitioning protein